MSFKLIATIAAVDSLVFGIAGLIAPGWLAASMLGELDPSALALARLAAAAYVGYGVLAWMARAVEDPHAVRAISSANAISWALSAGVLVASVASGSGAAGLWATAAMQLTFAIAWSVPLVRGRAAPAGTGRAGAGVVAGPE